MKVQYRNERHKHWNETEIKHRVIEETADHGNADCATVRRISKGKISTWTNKAVVLQRMMIFQESDAGKKLHIKRTLRGKQRFSAYNENAKDKMLETDTNL